MKSYFFVLFWALFQRFCSPVGAANNTNVTGSSVLEYQLSNGPLELTQANLRILSFNLYPSWVDFTLEYYHNGSASTAQWFGLGFGNTVMKCTYALTFEPRLSSSNMIKDVVITERRLADHAPGIELMPRLAYVQTDIIESPIIKIRIRIIRQRVVPINFLIAKNDTQQCPTNPYGYYQFPFSGSSINIIYAKGVDGALNVSYHTPPNHGSTSIQLQPITAISASDLNISIPLNATNETTWAAVSCPMRFELQNDTYAQRLGWPYVPRVCGTCSNNATFNVTLMPYTTQIQQQTGFPQSGVQSFDSLDLLNSTEYFTCMPMSTGVTSDRICGCTSVDWNSTSLLFLIDGSGYQNNTEWREFTWSILQGFVIDVMQLVNSNLTTSTNTSNMDVNIIIYGGLNIPLKVQKLDWNLLQSIQADPIPMTDRYFSNLCNATTFALDYLSYSNRTSRILITLPWQSPSDELECLLAGENYTFAGVQTFTPKVFDTVDLSLLEVTFGAYDDCTYLYENKAESAGHSLQAWPYVLAAISDFVCVASEIPILPGGNITFEMIMISTLNLNVLANYSRNMSEVIEANFEVFSNFTLVGDRDFDVVAVSFGASDIIALPSKPGVQEIIMTPIVDCKDKIVKEMILLMLKDKSFSIYMNRTLARFFGVSSLTSFIYSVEGIPLNNTGFNVTQPTGIQSSTTIQSTAVASTTAIIFNTSSISVTLFNVSMSTTSLRTNHGGVSVLTKIRRFFHHLVWWRILIIVAASLVVFSLLMLCLCCLCTRCCMANQNSPQYSNCNYDENVPITNTEV
jgi:hypothetical protein